MSEGMAAVAAGLICLVGVVAFFVFAQKHNPYGRDAEQ